LENARPLIESLSVESSWEGERDKVFVDVCESLMVALDHPGFKAVGEALLVMVRRWYADLMRSDRLLGSIALLAAISKVVQWRVLEEISGEQDEFALSPDISDLWLDVFRLAQLAWSRFEGLPVPGEVCRLSLGRSIGEAFNLQGCILEMVGGSEISTSAGSDDATGAPGGAVNSLEAFGGDALDLQRDPASLMYANALAVYTHLETKYGVEIPAELLHAASH
jgi:hypothetical protein